MKRRGFIATTTMAAATMATFGNAGLALPKKNPLPQWKGFNLLDVFSPDPDQSRRQTTEDNLKWMQDWGFDFVRIPMAYPYYLDIDRTKNITPGDVYRINEQNVERIDNLVYLAHKYNMHVSLNLHRAPGYC